MEMWGSKWMWFRSDCEAKMQLKRHTVKAAVLIILQQKKKKKKKRKTKKIGSHLMQLCVEFFFFVK